MCVWTVSELSLESTEFRLLECRHLGKHSGPPFLLSETQIVQGKEGINDCHLGQCVSSMGHPGKLISSQVVAIQWYLLQGRMLVFVACFKQLLSAVKLQISSSNHLWWGVACHCLAVLRNKTDVVLETLARSWVEWILFWQIPSLALAHAC